MVATFFRTWCRLPVQQQRSHLATVSDLDPVFFFLVLIQFEREIGSVWRPLVIEAAQRQQKWHQSGIVAWIQIHFRTPFHTNNTYSIIKQQNNNKKNEDNDGDRNNDKTTSGQCNLTTGRIAAAYGRFNDIRQVAPVYTPLNTCFLRPTWVQIPNGISIGSAVVAQIMAERSYTSQWAALSLPLRIAPSHGGIWTTI